MRFIKAPTLISALQRPLVKNALILLPILLNFFYIFKYSVNLPRYDDYDSILEFLANFKKNPFPNNIHFLFQQHIEHRIFTTRFVALFYYSIFGNINFRGLIFFNFLLALLLFFSIIYLIRKLIPGHWAIAAIALSMCLFDIINADLSDWAMSGIQNYGVNLFFICSIIFYNRKEKIYTLFAFVLQILCVYTSGNGHVGSLFIVIYNILNKNKINSVISILALLIFSPLYYYDYHPGASTLTTDLYKVVPFFLHTVGSHFSFEYGILAGCILLFFTALLSPVKMSQLSKIDTNVLPFICITGYIIASQVLMSFFRGNLPVIVAYSSRYLIYSHFLLVIIFIFLLLKIERDDFNLLISTKKQISPVPIISIIFAILSLSFIFNFFEGKNYFESMHKTLTTELYFFPDSAKAKRITDDACNLNIYCIEKERLKTN